MKVAKKTTLVGTMTMDTTQSVGRKVVRISMQVDDGEREIDTDPWTRDKASRTPERRRKKGPKGGGCETCDSNFE
jgi:hypothetical protein